MAPGHWPSNAQQLETLEFADKVTGELLRFFMAQSKKDGNNDTSRQLYTCMLEIHEWLAEQTSAMLEDDGLKPSLDVFLRNLEKFCKASRFLHPEKRDVESCSSHDGVLLSGLRVMVQQSEQI